MASPTPIICTTIGGNTLVSDSGCTIVLPSAIFSLVYRMAFSTTALPAVFATTSSASRMGTPELIMVPRVRVKRATATLRTSCPKIGVRMTNESHCTRPRGQLIQARKAITAAMMKATRYPI